MTKCKVLAASLLLSAGTTFAIPTITSLGTEEALPGSAGRLPHIATDSKDQAHIVSDIAGYAGYNMYSRVGSSWTWTQYTANGNISPQFYNPHIEINEADQAWVSGVLWWQGGMGIAVYNNVATAGTATRASYRTNTGGLNGLPVSNLSLDPTRNNEAINFGGNGGLWQRLTWNGSSIVPGASGSINAGKGGEKNYYWVSRAGDVNHPGIGPQAVWHGGTEKFYNNSLRNAQGGGQLTWCDFNTYGAALGNDGTYPMICGDSADPNTAYMALDLSLAFGSGIILQIWNGSQMVRPLNNLIVVDPDGVSGLRRFEPQMWPANGGGAWICWTSNGKIRLRFIPANATSAANLGPISEFEGFIGGVTVDSQGDLHVTYLKGNGSTRYYRKLSVTGDSTGPRASAVTRAVDLDGDDTDDIVVYDEASNTFRGIASGGGNIDLPYGTSGDIAVAGNYKQPPARGAASRLTISSQDNYAIFRPGEGKWYIRPDGGGSNIEYTLGDEGSICVPADYDGDGYTDPAVMNPTTYVWTIIRSLDNVTTSVQHGVAGDIPVPGDYDGDAKDDVAIFRVSDGVVSSIWAFKPSSGTGPSSISKGWVGDRPAPGDYDGDGQTDPCVYREGNGTWYYTGSTAGGQTQVWGGAGGGAPVPGDYDGDGTDDFALHNAATGRWDIRKSSDGNILSGPPVFFGWPGFDFGVPGHYQSQTQANVAVYRPRASQFFIRDLQLGQPSTMETFSGGTMSFPIAGDYDGDGLDDPGAVDLRSYTWNIAPSGGGANIVQQFGWFGDFPIKGDFDNDGTDDFAVYRQSKGITSSRWFIELSGGGRADTDFGWVRDLPIACDYDGDGQTDIAVYRPSNGVTDSTWFINASTEGRSDVGYGWTSDVPVPADYDGDGRCDIAVFRPATGDWYIRGTGKVTPPWSRTSADIPIPMDFDGDGKADIAVYRSGEWRVLRSTDGKEMIGTGPIWFGGNGAGPIGESPEL